VKREAEKGFSVFKKLSYRFLAAKPFRFAECFFIRNHINDSSRIKWVNFLAPEGR
jgi:hypothetical protein